MIPQDLDRFLQSASEVQSVPLAQVSAESVQVNNTILDQGTINRDIRIEVDARSPAVLDLGHHIGPHRSKRGIVVTVLVEVERMPMLAV